jgi:hypothetical protein
MGEYIGDMMTIMKSRKRRKKQSIISALRRLRQLELHREILSQN